MEKAFEAEKFLLDNQQFTFLAFFKSKKKLVDIIHSFDA